MNLNVRGREIIYYQLFLILSLGDPFLLSCTDTL